MSKQLTALLLFVSTTIFGQLSFQDSATLKGVGVSYGASNVGGGVSFYDFDNDGWDDLTFATTEGEDIYFFKNINGVFAQIDLGITNTSRNKQVLWVDYDNDDDQDFFVANLNGANKLYENTGNLTFVDVSASCGLFTDDLYTSGASFGDIDNDGDLDVFISNRDITNFNQANYLYRNDNGLFIDITTTSGITLGNQLSFCSAFFDYDNDGDQDIYVANDRTPQINRLYQNDGTGFFTDVSESSGAGIGIDAMSTTIGDYNNDGWFDIYVTNSPDGNQHLRNNGDGTFTNVAAVVGMEPSVGTGFFSVGWGSVFLDADNDADLDLYVSSSMDGTIPSLITSAFYENDGSHSYTIPNAIGFENDALQSYSNAIGDFNNDGLPDIVVMNDLENNFLWENTTTNSNSWLKLKLEGVQSNKDGIGSRIEISINGNKQFRYTLCGEGYLGQNSGTEFFGLGSAAIVDYVKVTWTSGTEDVYNDVAANQFLTLVEGNSLSVNTYEAVSGINLFPNPVQNHITISNIKSETTLTIYNIIGEKVNVSILNTGTHQIDMKNLSNGVYIFNFESEKQFVSKRIIKQ